MAQPQEPIIVFEPNGGLCAYFTPEAAVGHYKSIEWMDQVEFFDARGRRLRPVAGSSSELEEDSEQDHGPQILERVRRSLAETKTQLGELSEKPTTKPKNADDMSQEVSRIRALLEEEPKLKFNEVVEKLTGLLHATPETHETRMTIVEMAAAGSPHPPGTPWSHYCQPHHR